MKLFALAVVSGLLATAIAQTTDCAVCVVVLTLVAQFGGNPSPANDPEAGCKAIGLCTGACTLFNGTWPVQSPEFPTDGGVIDKRALRSLAEARPAVAKAAAGPLGGALRSAATQIATRQGMQAFLRFFRTHTAAKASDSASTLTDAITLAARWMAERFIASTGGVSAAATVDAEGAAVAATNPCTDIIFDLKQCIDRVFNQHLPLVDGDGDNMPGDLAVADDFTSRHFRGADWRGRDCDDTRADVYPGRRDAGNASLDSNCNGIVGTDPATGTSYEELFCSGPNAPMGLAILGDSAAAHFHLPPELVNARSLNFSGVLELAANEADWPQCSWSTGYRNATQCPALDAAAWGNRTAASIYARMRERNLCMHRDLQNNGVNGARTGSMAPPGIVNALARNQATDQPMLVFYALIGNDVCDGHPGDGSWTSVAEFQANVLSALQYLDTVLPAGSHVAFIPLADGRVLYDTTHTLQHPLGPTYPEVYEYLSCNGANPCWGWLNTNETWRNATTTRAEALTAVYDAIIAANASSFTHFDMHRVTIDWPQLIADYVATGGKAADIIEPVDGFHPSQTGNYLMAEVVWNDLVANKPQWLPAVNPNNAKIVQIFGPELNGY